MTERIKLTEDDIGIGHVQGGVSVRFCSLEGEEIVWTIEKAQQLKQQILDDQTKIDKITAYAKNLAYSNPHISWQLKQLLRNAPPKMVTYKVSCSKCSFEQDHEDVSLEKIKQIREDWNDNNKAKMKCLHDYQYRLTNQR